MVSVTLHTVWLNAAEDTSDYIAFPNMAALKVSTNKKGEVRRLAAGRDRLVMREGTQRTVSLSLPFCDRDQVEWLEDHIGQLVCVRDDRGRKFYAVYFAADIEELSYTTQYGNAEIPMLEVTHSEELEP